MKHLITFLCLSLTLTAATYDLAIINGRVMDPESGLDATRHVGIKGGIIRIISKTPIQAKKTINAKNLIVAPGFIDTELTRKVLGEKGIREMVAKVPIRRMGKPEEVARLVLWLSSNENTYVSAQNIAIDGGFTRV